jgi:predicted transcriptional regulator
MAVKKSSENLDETRSRICEAVAIHPDLDGVDLRVFLYLSAYVGFLEFVSVPQIQLATMLGRRKEHISRSIRKLTEAGILIPGPEGTRSSRWRLNPDYGR